MLKSISVCTALLIFALSCLGQDKLPATEAKWTRIETENKEVSAAFPDDFLMDANTKTFNQRYKVFGFKQGVSVSWRIGEPSNPKLNFSRISAESDNAEVSTFDFNGVSGKIYLYTDERYFKMVHFFVRKEFYTFSISSNSQSNVVAGQFLCSILVKGKQLFNCKEKNSVTESETVLISTLKTSPQILEVLNRKSSGEKGKVSYVNYLTQTNEKPKPEDISKRPAIILRRESPQIRALRVEGAILLGKSNVKIRAVLLANGQIGSLTAPSKFDKGSLNSYIDALRKTKFIPAEIDGKPVDSEYTFVYEIETT
jgi:hypothetical protein